MAESPLQQSRSPKLLAGSRFIIFLHEKKKQPLPALAYQLLDEMLTGQNGKHS
jgi:hypothetical protein